MKMPLLLALVLGASSFHSLAGAFRDDADTVIVSRGGQDLLLKDVDIMVSDLDPSIRGGYMDSPERIDRTLNGLLLARQIAEDARKAGLHENEEFKRRRLLAEEAILMKLQIAAYVDGLPRPDFGLLAHERYVVDIKGEWNTPERRDVSHILISTNNRSDEAAMELAQDIRKRLVDGANFGEMARTYSDDKKLPEGNGLLDRQFWRIEKLIKGKTEKSFENAAWSLKEVGELSPIVKTSYGYHVIRLDGVTPGVKRPFEDVKDSIIDAMTAQWKEEQRQQYLASFKAMPMEAEPEQIAALRTRYISEADAAPATEAAPAADSQ